MSSSTPERSQFKLLAERRFGPFFVVQFLGAFNDNVFKQALVILLAYQTASFTAMSSDTLQNLAQALFILPFLLFSAAAGQIADKYDKSRLITLTITLELAVMALGAVGFMMQSLPLLLTALFLGGLQSTLFGPVKYAILPQQLSETELVGGNALVETGTSIAVLLGMIYGGWLIAQSGWGITAVAISTCVISALALVIARFIPSAPAADPTLCIAWNPLTETWRNLRALTERRTVFLSILGISWFWFYGAMLVTQLPNLSRNVLSGTEHVVTLLLIVFSIGIGVGSLLCERLSGHKVEIGLVPFGSIGLTVFGIDLWWATSTAPSQAAMSALEFLQDPAHLRVLIDLTLIGMFGGLYSVPLYALVQSRSDPASRSRTIAGNNILNALFIIAAAALAAALLHLRLTIPEVILITALLNAAVAIYIYTLVPEFLMRFMVWLLIHTVYRLEKTGLERLPQRGAGLLVSNHVSFVDALVISAACPRPIRWVMDHRIFKKPLLRFFFRTARAIPIAPAREDSQTLDRAYDAIADALERGELVGIFPEGRLTQDGEIGPFRAGGVRRIIGRTPVPVLPLALSGLWESLFAKRRQKPQRSSLRFFPRIRVAVGEAVPPSAAAPDTLRAAVLALRGDWK